LTKFYVIDDAPIDDRAYKYESSGAAIAPETLYGGNTVPRGIAANSTGTTYWVADSNKNVYVYDRAGVLLGSWSAGGLSSSATLTGIATNGTDIWLVDSYADKVYKYTGAASLRSGSQNAASSFKLSKSDTNPQDIVTDGTSFWVVDGSALKVFKYSLSGSSLGSWTIDAANKNPTGITINPNNVSDIWIVDNGTKKVYQYAAAASRTSGSQNAASSFALDPRDTNPEGIADPPVGDVLISRGNDTFAANLTTSTAQNPAALNSAPVLAVIPPLTSHDALWAAVGGELMKSAGVPLVSLCRNAAVAASSDRGLKALGIFGESHSSALRTICASAFIDGAGDNPSDDESLASALIVGENQASAAALDDFFALSVDQPPSAD
jgi:hypothetical protein